jgi:hypothetical protein
MVYTTSIVTIKTNKYVGWPLWIPLKCEQQQIGLVVNIAVGGLVAIPYQLALKYLDYKDVNLNARVEVF